MNKSEKLLVLSQEREELESLQADMNQAITTAKSDLNVLDLQSVLSDIMESTEIISCDDMQDLAEQIKTSGYVDAYELSANVFDEFPSDCDSSLVDSNYLNSLSSSDSSAVLDMVGNQKLDINALYRLDGDHYVVATDIDLADVLQAVESIASDYFTAAFADNQSETEALEVA